MLYARNPINHTQTPREGSTDSRQEGSINRFIVNTRRKWVLSVMSDRTGQRPVELTKGKWNDIVRKKQNFQPDRSVPFTFRPKFLYSSVKRSKTTTSRGGSLFSGNFHLDRSVPFMFRPKLLLLLLLLNYYYYYYYYYYLGNFGMMENTQCLYALLNRLSQKFTSIPNTIPNIYYKRKIEIFQLITTSSDLLSFSGIV